MSADFLNKGPFCSEISLINIHILSFVVVVVSLINVSVSLHLHIELLSASHLHQSVSVEILYFCFFPVRFSTVMFPRWASCIVTSKTCFIFRLLRPKNSKSSWTLRWAVRPVFFFFEGFLLLCWFLSPNTHSRRCLGHKEWARPVRIDPDALTGAEAEKPL